VPTFRYVLVDVFTDTPLAGNALAVFTDAREIPEESLQLLARETNLSETAFVYPPTVEDAHAKIRIFTPGVEVPSTPHRLPPMRKVRTDDASHRTLPLVLRAAESVTAYPPRAPRRRRRGV